MRPKFLPPEVSLRSWMSRGALDKHLIVGNLLASSYVAKCERLGRPIPRLKGGGIFYRLLDVIARANADGIEIRPTEDVQLKIDIQNLREQKEALLIEISNKKHNLELQNTSIRLTAATLLSEDEIIAAKVGNIERCGVYFLILNNKIIYIGQSVRVFSRVCDHAKEKSFDSFSFIPCNRKNLDVMESLYIHLFRPPLNGRWNNNIGMCAPLRLDELLGIEQLDAQCKVK